MLNHGIQAPRFAGHRGPGRGPGTSSAGKPPQRHGYFDNSHRPTYPKKSGYVEGGHQSTIAQHHGYKDNSHDPVDPNEKPAHR